MEEITFHAESVLWGQTYEVLVKRGVLACLIEQHIVPKDYPSLQPWREIRLLGISSHVTRKMDLLDEAARDVVKAAVNHMALTAFGVGYTATRAYLEAARTKFKGGSELTLRALWCPLLMPGTAHEDWEEAQAATRNVFQDEFKLEGTTDPQWSAKGHPANADFLLWLSANDTEDMLLVQEYSFDMPGALGDFREQGAHLDELMRHRRIVDSRSVFARVAAEVPNETFELSSDIKNYFSSLTSDNKPLYKLCQAASYAEKTVALLQSRGALHKTCTARALAITPNGLESLAARYVPGEADDAKIQLMAQLGSAYRQTEKLSDNDSDALTAGAEQLFRGLISKLPTKLRAGLSDLTKMPAPGEDYEFRFKEELTPFANPTDQYSLDQATAMVDETPELRAFFEGSARTAVRAVMTSLASDRQQLSLRDIHAAAIVAGLQASKRGRLNVLALEGNPGIGKTTAIRKHLGSKTDAGYLFLYVSPRVIINRDVTSSLARTEDQDLTGILTVTTNAQLIAAAERWHKRQVELGQDTPRVIQGAVVADGVEKLRKPQGSILVLDPDQEQQIDSEHAGSTLKKNTLSEHEDLVQERSLPGVLKSLSSTARELLALNPSIDRLVLTAALQGFRERANQKTTIDALSSLFVNKAATSAGRAERRQFASKMPTVVVMVDELAGDGAGARFVHTVASWLQKEFIAAFEDEPCPFTVTLVVSDASLGNEVVLDQYLNAGDRAPDKVLVSKSGGDIPFRLAATKVKIGNAKRDVLHVMTNSYPASELHLDYRVRLTSVKLQETKQGDLETPRQAVRRVAEDATLTGAQREILKALEAGARQVIYFAQDKLFLRRLQKALCSEATHGLSAKTVKVLDSSIPGFERKRLLEQALRDSVRVFLMTSSGARGVSFPLTDWIIASVPRFNIEAALMEIAQLIYRGRGKYRDANGIEKSGDCVPRHLVMMIDDYIVSEERLDKRQWLRQSMDLLTLLVMLRATIYTRITGDSGLRQKIALVPVGAVGTEELVSVMSQHVSNFVKEAEVFKLQSKDRELVGLAERARANVIEIFSHTKLNGVAKPGEDGRTMVKPSCLRALCDVAANAMSPLLSFADQGTSMPEHVHFNGPIVIENWTGFEKQEVFAFEGHETQVSQASRQLIAQLYAIDDERGFSAAMRIPAASLLRLLQRDLRDAANEFRTLKDLKSPNTWIAVPAGMLQFICSSDQAEGEPFRLRDEGLWQEGLGRSLNAGSAFMPPIASYESFPWGAAVGLVSPLKLDLVFDDRYFMASNELNLLNTLLLAAADANVSGEGAAGPAGSGFR
jgi:hypothetical protein